MESLAKESNTPARLSEAVANSMSDTTKQRLYLGLN